MSNIPDRENERALTMLQWATNELVKNRDCRLDSVSRSYDYSRICGVRMKTTEVKIVITEEIPEDD